MNLEERWARFAPVALTADPERLTERERALVRRLIEVGRQVHTLYLRQVWPGNPDLRADLAASPDPADRLRLRLFDLMGGPWDRFDDDHPFVGDAPRPAEGDFYPPGFTPAELDAWLADHPEERPAMTGYFTLIRRREGGGLEAVPYHRAYKEALEAIAAALAAAAALADHAPLAEYLELRAQALLTDDYFDSDCAWVALQDGPLEAVVGPYEVYEDRLLGYKAAYQAMVGLRDAEESDRLRGLVDALPALAAHLPVPREYQGEVAGLASPITVVDTLMNAGLLAAVAIPTAFVLPNDRRVRTTVGTKKVLLRNVYQAKFERIVRPIAERLLEPEQAAAIAFAPAFAHILLHEVSHALGAQMIPGPDGALQPVPQALRDLFPPIEEAKAEVVGLYNLLFLVRERFFPEEWRDQAPPAFLASILRLTRTGTEQAHARANLLAWNLFCETGAIRQDRSTGRFRAEPHKMAQAIKELSAILLRIEGEGDMDAAQALLRRYGAVPEELRRAWAEVADVPLDLAPTYPGV